MRTLFFKITFILMLLLLIGGFNVDAFGREYTTTGKIAIGQGKGTVVVEIWTAKIGSDSKDDWKETTGAQVTVSGKANDGLFSLQYRYFRFWAKSADEGYTFDAWYTNAECTENRTPNSGSDYYQTSNSCYGPTYEYYAKFIPNPYTITLDNQSATTAGTASIAVTFDANTNLTSAITKPTRTGYTFKGYYTGKNGSGVQIINQNGNVVASAAGGGNTYTDASRNWKYASSITLYAHWTANNYTVTLESNVATNHGTPSFGVTYDAATPASITPPSRDKYTFWGYYTGENGEGTMLIDRNGNVLASVSGYTDSSRKWKYANNLTLHAYMTAKSDQTLSWDIIDGNEYTTGTLGAVASSGLKVTYTCDYEEWAYINVNNRLVVVEPNKTVTITAYQTGNDYYNAAEPISRTFITLGGHPNQVLDVHASNITYGDLLSASTLSGKVYLDGVEIAGTLSWVDPMIMPNAGTANHMVLFTPTNTAAYSSVYFEVPVTVAKANPVITWNISTALRENTIYSSFVVSTNNEEALTITEASDYLSASGLVLTVGEIGEEEKAGITVTVHQDASDNYNEITSTKTITIYPKVAQCLPVAPLTEDKLGKMGAKYDNSVWCSTNSQGAGTFASCDVHYTQAEGIALGTWQDGFTGFDLVKLGKYIIGQAEFTWSTKWVELSFTGIPDRLSFTTELQVVSFNLAGWHEVNVTGDTWKVYQKAPGGSYTQVGTDGAGAFSFNEALNEDTRYIKIEYTGNFAGFVKGLAITRKETLTADKSSLTFGTEAHPLQEPQTLTLSYSSLGDCAGDNDHISVTSNNAAFYVDEAIITENVGIEQKGTYTVRVRCNDVAKSGKLTFTSNDGKTLEVSVNSTTPAITTTATSVFQTGTEHATSESTPYRALKTHNFSACFDGSTPIFDTLYIYGVSESSAANRQWNYDASKGYKVPKISASNVHTPCFVYKKDGAQYTYVRTFDASTKTLNIVDSKKCGFVGYRAEAPAVNAIQVINGANVELYLNNTEIIASGAPLAVNATSKVYANGANILSSTSNAAVKLSGATTLSIEDTWTGAATSAILALRPASSYPSIDLGSASGKVIINGTQLELHNATNMAIVHMDGTTEKFDGEVQINDGSIGGAETLGMPKLTFIDGGTFNDGTVVAYTLKGVAKRPRNQFGHMVSRHPMAPETLESLVADEYSWYGHAHLTVDNEAKVNPMLMDEEVWIFTGDAGVGSDVEGSWNKGTGLPGEDDDVLINAPMVVSGGELKVKSLTINWEDKGKGIPAVSVNPDGGLTVGEGGIDAIKLANPAENLVLKAGETGETKGQTGFLRIHPESAEPMPKATVELYSTTWYNKANEAGNTTRFQCVGTPIADEGIVASTVFPTGTLLYAWNESSEKWTNSRSKSLEPFKGYDLSQKINNDGLAVTYTGLLTSDNQTLDLSYTSSEKGFNLLANSYTAPISIEMFDDDDFVNASQTIYILNAGTKAESNAQAGGLDAAGKWVGIPVKTAVELAAEGYPCVIPSMQGFWVQSTGAGAQLKLNYDRLVMGVTYTEPTANKPLRVAKSRETEQVGKLMINLYTETDADCVFILESDSYDAAYEDGYDARKIASETMDVFTIRDSEQLGVDATNSIIGTRVGVRTGEEMSYTLIFSHLQSKTYLALLDKETNETIDINEGTEYTFFAEPNSTITGRFMIVESANAPAIATGMESTSDSSMNGKATKFIKDNQLFILKNGVLYNAMGVIVR